MWISQSCFSLGFFSQNSLWKLSTFREYKGIYSRVCEECEKTFFSAKQGILATQSLLGWVASLSHEITARPNCPFCPIVLQMSWPFSFLYASHVWHFSESLVVSYSQVPVMRNSFNAHTLEFFTFFHTQSLHDSHLNTRYLIVKL